MSPSLEPINKTNGSATASSQTSQSDTLFNKIAAITCFSYLTSMLTIYMLVNEEVPQPYMDEIFHVQQVRSYCVHNFTYWNPKITTPPGLYFTTWVLFKPISELIAFAEEDPSRKCPVPMVRLMNLIFALGNVYLMYCISSKQHRYTARMSRIKTLVSSVSLSTLPPLFFFNFLYYTDAGSLFFILAMYLMHIRDQTWIASLFGFVSLFYRQTNIVWCFFFASYSALKLIQSASERSKKRTRLFSVLISTLPQIIVTLGGYVITGILFLLFLFYNKGVVLGDRNAHQASIHLAQIIYFLFFSCIFAVSWVFTLTNLKRFLLYCYKNVVTSLILTIAMVLMIKYQSPAHPYLLADNRHYTFYLWRRILGNQNSFIRFALTPMCLLMSWCFVSLLHRKDTLWRFLFAFCICTSVIPQQLLEFRYFIPAFVLWRLNISTNSSFLLTLEFAFNIFVNGLTFYMFLFAPFKWKDDDQLQRFMW